MRRRFSGESLAVSESASCLCSHPGAVVCYGGADDFLHRFLDCITGCGIGGNPFLYRFRRGLKRVLARLRKRFKRRVALHTNRLWWLCKALCAEIIGNQLLWKRQRNSRHPRQRGEPHFPQNHVDG
ncbi:Uncharacterized protein Rs2_21119 [Raphanus sativus]|nr:Uncharacterized protein Rs2_21119 [Raphanus sativus]